jgi:hypothetical protein
MDAVLAAGEITAGPEHAPVRQPGSACRHGAPACGAKADTIAALECVVEQACDGGIAANAADGASRIVTTASSAAIPRVFVLRNGLVTRSLAAS